MQKVDEVLAKYQSLLASSLHSSKKTEILDEITSRIGSLSTPSKMPGYAWSINAKQCKTGAKLAQIPGTVCASCYALKGCYTFSNTQNAMAKRLDGWLNDPDWAQLMSIRLLLLEEQWFRWFDSGDLQSPDMLVDINQVAINVPGTRFWLPTKEKKIVKQVGAIASNLTIRVSAAMIDEQINKFSTTSMVSSDFSKLKEDVYQCPSSKQNNQCQQCRECWEPRTKCVAYLKH